MTDDVTASERRGNSRRGDRLAPAFAAALAAAVAAGCGDSSSPAAARRPASPPLEDSVVLDAAWERAFDPSECTAVVEGRIIAPPGADPAAEFVGCPDVDVELLLPRPDGRVFERRAGTGRTGPDGRFRIEGATEDAFVVRATKPGHATNVGGRGLRMFGAFPVARSPDVEMAALPARRLGGEVVDRDGRPLRDVRVVAHAAGHLSEMRTDDAGAFAFDVPIGVVGISVLDPRCDVVRAGADVPPDGDVPPLRIVAPPTGPLAGTVVEADDGTPIAGAVVMWLDEPGRTTRTDAEGRFVLSVPRMGRVAAFTRNREWRSWDVPRAGDVEIRLRAARGVAGRVLDADGRPVADARLLAVGRSWDGPIEAVHGPRTGPDGTFDFSWAPAPARGDPGKTFVVAWHRRHGLSVPFALPTGTEPDAPRDVVLSGWREVEGQILSATETPVGGAAGDANVLATWTFEGLGPLEVAALGLPHEREAATGADGRFRLADVPASIPVTVRADLASLSLVHPVPPGESGPLRLTLPAGEILAGRVQRRDRSAPGAPGSVRIRLLDVPHLVVERATASAPDGSFRFDDVPPGRYELTATAEGFDLPGGCDARAGEADVVVVVEQSARVRVRITGDADGSADWASAPLVAYIDDLSNPAVPANRITVPPAGAAGVVAAGDEAGAVREVSTRVHPGDWRVRIEGDLWRGTADVLSVGDGEERDVAVRIERTMRVAGTLRDGAGAPLPGIQVLFAPLGGAAPAPVTTFSLDDGRLDVAGLRPGRWEVRISPRMHAPLRTEVELPSATPLDLRMPPHGTIAATVRLPDGSPGAGAIVSLRRPGGGDAHGWTEDLPNLASRFRADAEGRVRIVGLPVGEYVLEAQSGSSRFGARTVTVRAGETTEGPIGEAR